MIEKKNPEQNYEQYTIKQINTFHVSTRAKCNFANSLIIALNIFKPSNRVLDGD